MGNSPVINFDSAATFHLSKDFDYAKKVCNRSKYSISINEGNKCATLGILKIGANITFQPTITRTAANFDVLSVCRALSDNFHLHFITSRTRNTVIPKDCSFTDVEDACNKINDLGIDALLVFNGTVNNWGGEPNHATFAIWKIIRYFKGRVFYLHTDGSMRLHQIYDETFVKRGWDSRWPFADIYVDRDDIVYLTQARSPRRIKDLTNGNSIIPIKEENIFYFPIQEAILLRSPKLPKERKIYWDLIYGGSYRNGRRRDRMAKWYFGHENLKTLMFGSISLDKFKGVQLDEPSPVFEGAIQNAEYVSKLSTGLATVHIVDPWYEDHWVSLRFYEALIAGVVPFIDIEADRRKKLYFPGSVLENFLYVKKRKDLTDRIQLIKNEDCLNEVLDLCKDSVRSRWNKQGYKDLLKDIILKRIEL